LISVYLSVHLSVCHIKGSLSFETIESWNFAWRWLEPWPKKLPTRFMIFFLEPEIFDVKDDKKWNFFLTPFCLFVRTSIDSRSRNLTHLSVWHFSLQKNAPLLNFRILSLMSFILFNKKFSILCWRIILSFIWKMNINSKGPSPIIKINKSLSWYINKPH